MKRKHSSTSTQGCPSTATSSQTSHQAFPLLQLPRELRVQVLQHLLYCPEPLGAKLDGSNYTKYDTVRPHRNLKLYPAILRVSQQIYNEGCEVLYRQNTAIATIDLGPIPGLSRIKCVDDRICIKNLDTTVARRFTKWDVTIMLNINIPKHATREIFDFVSLLIRIPDLTKLKVQLLIWDTISRRTPTWIRLLTFENPHDFDDAAEQIFRPFSIIRVKQVSFVDRQGCPIRAALSLSDLVMGDTAPPSVTLQELFDGLISFLNSALTKQSRKVVKARLAPLKAAYYEYDIDVFRFALRSFLAYLSHFRALVPPQYLVDFAQQLAPCIQ